jgi:ABC-type dipeptide/oligopeptide/nickel transport system permease component
LLSGVFVMVVNIVTDFIYVLVDPRLSLTDSQA